MLQSVQIGASGVFVICYFLSLGHGFARIYFCGLFLKHKAFVYFCVS